MSSEQLDALAFFVVDDSYPDKETLNAKLAKGLVKKYDTLEALASDNGINVSTFMETVKGYNTAAAEGKDIPAKLYTLSAKMAAPLKTAPYYIEKITLRTFGTLPGIEIDTSCRVLNGEGKIIPGLYAAGEVAVGNAFSRQYPGIGVGIYWAANSGRYAAEVIADTLK